MSATSSFSNLHTFSSRSYFTFPPDVCDISDPVKHFETTRDGMCLDQYDLGNPELYMSPSSKVYLNVDEQSCYSWNSNWSNKNEHDSFMSGASVSQSFPVPPVYHQNASLIYPSMSVPNLGIDLSVDGESPQQSVSERPYAAMDKRKMYQEAAEAKKRGASRMVLERSSLENTDLIRCKRGRPLLYVTASSKRERHNENERQRVLKKKLNITEMKRELQRLQEHRAQVLRTITAKYPNLSAMSENYARQFSDIDKLRDEQLRLQFDLWEVKTRFIIELTSSSKGPDGRNVKR